MEGRADANPDDDRSHKPGTEMSDEGLVGGVQSKREGRSEVRPAERLIDIDLVSDTNG